MYCIDTNIAIDILRGDETLKEKISRLVVSREEVFISSISLCELFKGVYLIEIKEKQDEALLKIKSFISSFEVVDFEEVSCEEFGRIYSFLKKIGKMVTEPDIMIAAMVKVNNLILITRDKKHFKNLGIKVEDW